MKINALTFTSKCLTEYFYIFFPLGISFLYICSTRANFLYSKDNVVLSMIKLGANPESITIVIVLLT